MGDLGAFIETIDPRERPVRRSLLEKDYLLHSMLTEFANRPGLRDQLLLKGGTCLLKSYLGYYRFSEDADFTWRDQRRWRGKTTRAIRNDCSQLISSMTAQVGELASDIGLRFVPDKSDRRFVEASSGGRMVRFYMWFDSVVDGQEQPLKFEVNFVETIIDPLEVRDLRSYIGEIKDESLREVLTFRFPEEVETYTRSVSIPCYSPREIYLEKCRAVMTRVGFKWRDLVDIVFLEDRFGFDIGSERDHIFDKTRPVLAFDRYRSNLERMADRDLDRMPAMEEGLLLEDPSEDLNSRMAEAFRSLKDLAGDLKAG